MKLKEPLLYWLRPDVDDEVSRAIDSGNIRAVHFIGLIIAVLETVALTVYFISHLRHLGEPPVIDAILRVLIFILVSFAAFIVSDKLLAPDGSPRISHRALSVILSVYFFLNVLWGDRTLQKRRADGDLLHGAALHCGVFPPPPVGVDGDHRTFVHGVLLLP